MMVIGRFWRWNKLRQLWRDQRGEGAVEKLA